MDATMDTALRAAPSSALVTLIVFAVLAVWRGWLIPRSTVDKLDDTARRVADVHEQRLTESRERELEWRKAWEVSEAARAILATNVADQLEGLRTLEALIRALPAALPRRGDRS